MSFALRPIQPEELGAFVRVGGIAFGSEPTERDIADARSVMACERSLAVFDAERIVATAALVAFELTLPGGITVAAPGVSFVAVLPTHRRRGLLRTLMGRQLDDLAAAGAALAILYASESGIYGRFGYAPATHARHLEIERRAAFRLPSGPPGTLALLDRAAALATLPPLYERFRRLQPGAITRSTPAWEVFTLPAPGDKANERFQVLYADRDGRAEGYIRYHLEPHWEQGRAAYTLVLDELISLTMPAYAALWQYCLNLDLVRIIRAPNCSVDEPLGWLLSGPRDLRTTALNDGLWLRLIDIPAALTARRYATEGRLVLRIEDSFLPGNAGTYMLDVGLAGASCRRAEESADLALGVEDLAATYLGGTRFGVLARAGRVIELTPGALLRADALFASEPAPWCPVTF